MPLMLLLQLIMAIFVAAAGDEHIFLRGNEIDATLNERKFVFYVFLIGAI